MATATLPISRSSRGPRFLRWLRYTVIGGVALLALLLVMGVIYQIIGTWRDRRRFPQQGHSVALGPKFSGLSLNINCAGQGSPTVILDSGLGVPAVGWSLVQPKIAEFTRVCSYDRAGYGWSDAGPMPRTSAQIVKELHALLEAAQEPGPYVLVGHSFGGYNVRVYNHEYPKDVAGVVLVDASHEDQLSRMPPDLQTFEKRETEAMRTQKVVVPILIRLGVLRLLSNIGSTGGPGISKDLREEWLFLALQGKFIQADASEQQSLSESADEVRAAGNLADKPLIVLTAGKTVDLSNLPKGVSKKDMEDFQQVWMNDLQVQQSHLSTRGKQIIVPDSDHNIPFERPDTIVNAVREVLTEAKSR